MSAEAGSPVVTLLTTSGPRIGLGHLRRCLTLAGALADRGARIEFVLSGSPTGVELAQAAGFAAERVGEIAQDCVAALVPRRGMVLVVDDYAIGEAELRALRPGALALATLDDLADRDLPVDLVLNASPAAARLPYELPEGCVRLFGPGYALLGTSFRGLPSRDLPREISSVLVTFGGADPRGQTAAVVGTVLATLPQARLDVVLGPLYEGGAIAAHERLTIHRAPDGLLPLMLRADLAVTAGGHTTYELAACGLPAIALCAAENQLGNLVELEAAGSLCRTQDEGPDLARVLGALSTDPARRQRMSDAGRALVDGRGALRVADALLMVVTEKERAWRS